MKNMGIYNVHIAVDKDSVMFTVNETAFIVIVDAGKEY